MKINGKIYNADRKNFMFEKHVVILNTFLVMRDDCVRISPPAGFQPGKSGPKSHQP
jgi:hypothetical protein